MCFQINGSFTQDTFTDVIRHLIDHNQPGKKLLILDGHSSHHTMEALDLYVTPCYVITCDVELFFSMSCHAPHATRCVQHDIHVLNLPANLTHLLQVPDVSVFGPFKTMLAQTMAAREHEGHSVVQPHEIATVTRKAWEKAASDVNIIAGFKKTGIWPLDPSKITPSIPQRGRGGSRCLTLW